MKSKDVSNILQIYLIWLNDTIEKYNFYQKAACMAKQLAGHRE